MPKDSKMMRLFITTGQEEKLEGKCIYFIRAKPDVSLNARNIQDVLNLDISFNQTKLFYQMSPKLQFYLPKYLYLKLAVIVLLRQAAFHP